jgi:subtilisin family serine protease
VTSELIDKLTSDPRVNFAEPNFLLFPDLPPDDPEFGQLWGLHNTGQAGGTIDADIDAPEAWDITTGTPSLVVAVIDTGVDINHSDLAANIWSNLAEVNGTLGVDDDLNGYIDDFNGWDF